MSNSDVNQAYFDEWHQAEVKKKVAEAVASERERILGEATAVLFWASENFEKTIERDRAVQHIIDRIQKG